SLDSRPPDPKPAGLEGGRSLGMTIFRIGQGKIAAADDIWATMPRLCVESRDRQTPESRCAGRNSLVQDPFGSGARTRVFALQSSGPFLKILTAGLLVDDLGNGVVISYWSVSTEIVYCAQDALHAPATAGFQALIPEEFTFSILRFRYSIGDHQQPIT